MSEPNKEPNKKRKTQREVKKEIKKQYNYYNSIPIQPIIVKGKRVALVPIDKENAPLYFQWINDYRGRRWLRNVFPHSLHSGNQWISRENNPEKKNSFTFEILYLEENKIIGNCSIMGIDWINRNAWIGLFIGDQSYWNKGIGTESIKLLLKIGFEEWNLHKLQAGIFDLNKGSLGVARKAGLKDEMIIPKEIFIDGKWIDTHFLSIFEQDWFNIVEKDKNNKNNNPIEEFFEKMDLDEVIIRELDSAYKKPDEDEEQWNRTNFREGKNLVIRALSNVHEDYYYNWLNNEINRLLRIEHWPVVKKELEQLFVEENSDSRHSPPNFIPFEIWSKKEEKPIGLMVFRKINWMSRTATVELVFDTPLRWKSNDSVESLKIASDYLFSELNFRRIEIAHPSYAQQLGRSIEKAGFLKRGTIREMIRYKGQYFDLIEYMQENN